MSENSVTKRQVAWVFSVPIGLALVVTGLLLWQGHTYRWKHWDITIFSVFAMACIVALCYCRMQMWFIDIDRRKK